MRKKNGTSPSQQSEQQQNQQQPQQKVLTKKRAVIAEVAGAYDDIEAARLNVIEDDNDNIQKLLMSQNLNTYNHNHNSKVNNNKKSSTSKLLIKKKLDPLLNPNNKLLANSSSSSSTASTSSSTTTSACGYTVGHDVEDNENMEFQNNNNNSQANNNKNNNSSKRNSKKTWILFLLPMTIALILAAILLIILVLPTLLDQDDKCFNSFQEDSYKLFATKTAYSFAKEQLDLNDGNYGSGGSNGNIAGLNNFRQPSFSLNNNHQQVPKILMSNQGQTLSSLNDLLTSSRNCKLRQFHYIGRHAARYPSSDDIIEINELIKQIQAKIEPTKYNISSYVNTNSNNNNNNSQQPDATPTKVCLNPLAEFKSWSTPLSSENGNLITDFGFDETRSIAHRLKSIYPSMFDADQTKVEFGVTKELRTAQTALIFKELLSSGAGNAQSSSSSSQPPTASTSDPLASLSSLRSPVFVPENARNKQYLDEFIRMNRAQKLEFHDKCKSMATQVLKLTTNYDLDNENRTKSIAQSISKKLKLNKEQYLSAKEVLAIYDTCKYETAISTPSPDLPSGSIWCSLFSEDQLKFLEYLNDINKYMKVYAHPDQTRSACPVTIDLMKSFKSASSQQQQQQQNQQSYFYFTHSQVIQKILGNLFELETDPGFQEQNVIAHLNAGSYPENREWRTSLLSPFSANIAFSVYQCPLADHQRPAIPFSDIQVVTSVNERPVLIDGCSDLICSLDRILDDAKISKEKRCKMEDICRREIKAT